MDDSRSHGDVIDIPLALPSNVASSLPLQQSVKDQASLIDQVLSPSSHAPRVTSSDSKIASSNANLNNAPEIVKIVHPYDHNEHLLPSTSTDAQAQICILKRQNIDPSEKSRLVNNDKPNVTSTDSGEISSSAQADVGQQQSCTATERGLDPPKRAGISRSTYFRAKRNLRSHGTLKPRTSGKQIGRPQKIDANAEKLIQDALSKQPGTELKQLQQLVLDNCHITVSLSSISRRLKALGCSPTQTGNMARRPQRPRLPSSETTRLSRNDPIAGQAVSDHASEDNSIIQEDVNRRSSIVEQHSLEHIHHNLQHHDLQHQVDHQLSEHDQLLQQDLQDLENYHRIAVLDTDLTSYDSPGMDLNMLQDMHTLETDYSELDPSKIGVVHDETQMYEYENYPSDDKEDALYDSPDLAHTLYQHSHSPQMLYQPGIDPSLM